MESNNDPDVSSDFPIPRIFDRSRFPNLDQLSNLPYTSSGSYNHYDPAQNFQAQAPNHGYQVAEQPMRPQAVYCQPPSFQAQAPNDGYQVAEQPMRPQAVYCQPPSLQTQAPNDGYQVAERPMHSQTVYGQANQGFLAPVENRGYQATNESQLEVEHTQNMEDEKNFLASLKAAAKLYKKIMSKKDGNFVAHETANKARLESATAEIIRLQNERTSKLGDIERLNENVNKLDADKNMILDENQDLKEQLVQLRQEKQVFTETISEKTSEVQVLKDQLSNKESEQEVSNVQIAALHGTLAEKEMEINQLNALTNSLRGELAAEKEEKQKVATKLQTLQQQHENVKSELAKKKLATKTIKQNFLVVSTIVDAERKSVSEKNGEHRKSVKRPIPTIDIDSGAGAIEQEEVHSAKKIEKESFKRKRDVKILMCSSTTRCCDADDSSHKKNGPSHQ